MNLDEQYFLILNNACRGDVLTFIFTWVTKLGDGLVLALIILPIMYLVNKKYTNTFKKHGVLLILSVTISGLIITGMKVAVDRPRPEKHFQKINEYKKININIPLGTPSDRSFPSGHTQTAFGAMVFLSFLYVRFSLIFITSAILVGLSRIALGVHFPLDVLTGAAIGTMFSVMTYYMGRKIKWIK